MRRFGIVLVLALLITACGGESDSSATGGGNDSVADGSGAPDPCTLADESVLTTYFGDAAGEPERSEAGPIVGCTWRDTNSNSLLIQVATDFDIFRPDPCDGCIDLSFGDDGYASGSPIQSTAKVIEGSLWVSVTTTGFGDDDTSIAALLETVFETATG